MTSFISIAVFGVFSMHFGMQSHNGNCVAAAVQGTDCPKQNNLFDFIFFHFNAFKNILTVNFGNIMALITVLFVFLAVLVLLENFSQPKLNFAFYKLRSFESLNLFHKYKFLHWLSLHENSPSVL